MKKASTVVGDFNLAITLEDAGMALGRGQETGPSGPADSAHVGTRFSNDVTYDPATGLFHDDGDTFPTAAGGSASTNNGSSSPVASIPTLATWLTNGFWTNQGALPHHWASNTITYNLGNLNAQEQALALSALTAWSQVANINFVQVSSGANINFNHNGTMQAVTNASWNGSGQMTSATIDISTDWITTDGGANDGKTGIDSYGYQTYIHELGHALGLGHQGPYNGSASYSTDAIYANDTWQFSIMSYFSENNYGGSSYRYVITPQMADIYAVQSIYGVQTGTRTGDTVYGFNNTAGSIYNFASYTQAPALTIYDSGGNDTLDCSGYSNNQTIDLHAGSFSSVGGLKNNIGIALGVNIERAIGGSGNDTLIANDNGCTLVGGGGSDTLIGGAGKDTMTGNAGADVFVFNSGGSSPANGQHDLITDFTSTDHIDLSAMGAFHFLGTAAFDGSAFALDYVYNSTTGITTVLGDTNGDRVADFAIDLTGNIGLSVGSFVGVQPASVVIESVGITSLVQSGGNVYLNPVAGGTGPTLKYQGAAVVAGQFGAYTPIGVEAVAGGYEVAWYNSATGQYSVWSTDGNGNYTGNYYMPGPGNTSAFESLEPSFHQDLNGDGVIGVPPPPPPPPPLPSPTVIESMGVTSLVQSGGNVYLNPVAGGTGPTLKYQGAAVVAGQFGAYTPIGVEAVAGGYEVAWYNSATGQYSVWSTDGNGNYTGNYYMPGPGNTSAFESLEPSFHQDLNGDGVIGVPPPPPPPPPPPLPSPTVIESMGVTSLVQSGGNFYLNPGAGGTGPTLKYQGSAVVTGQFGAYTPIGVEAVAGGYEVAWYNSATGQYSVWSTDGNGNYTGNYYMPGPGNTSAFESLEPSFHQDLNGDGTIGIPATPGTAIESAGSTALVQSGGNVYLNPVAGGTGPTLKYQGAAVVTGQFGAYTPIGVEAVAGGYEVAWYNSATGQYSVWSTDGNGNYTGNYYMPGPGNTSAFESLEPSFHQDLNGDGTIGVPAPATQGAVLNGDGVIGVPAPNAVLHSEATLPAATDDLLPAISQHTAADGLFFAMNQDRQPDNFFFAIGQHSNQAFANELTTGSMANGTGEIQPAVQVSLVSLTINARDDAATHDQNFAMSSFFKGSDALTDGRIQDSTSDPQGEHFADGLPHDPAHQNSPATADAAAVAFESGSGKMLGVVPGSALEKFDFNAPVNRASLISSPITALDEAASHNLFTTGDGNSGALTSHPFWASTSDAPGEHFAAGLLSDPVHQNIPVTEGDHWSQGHQFHWLV